MNAVAYTQPTLLVVRASTVSPIGSLNHMSLVSGQVLYEPNGPITDVFFVDEGVVSLTANTNDNSQVEVGLTGREGFVGMLTSRRDIACR